MIPKKNISIRLNDKRRAKLRQLAVIRRTTATALIEHAIDELPDPRYYAGDLNSGINGNSQKQENA